MNNKRLYKSNKDKVVAGVCGGIAEYFNIDSSIVRLIGLFTIFAFGSGLIFYIAAAIIVPERPRDTSYEENYQTTTREIDNRYTYQDRYGDYSSDNQDRYSYDTDDNKTYSSQTYSYDPDRKLYRSTQNRVIGGVCGGIAEYFNVDPTIIRIIFILLSFAYGGGLLAYFIAWLVIPERIY